MKTPEPVRAYLAAIGSVGGSAKSKAKADAVRANGKKGGRPVGAKDSKPRVRRNTGESP